MTDAVLAIVILGSVLFDERDVETYDPRTGTFTLTPGASKRLVENWDEVLANDEDVVPRGALVDAEGLELRVVLEERTVATGVVALLPGGRAGGGGPILCGAMPLVDGGRLRVALVAPPADLKALVEDGDAALSPVLGADVVAHLRSRGKV